MLIDVTRDIPTIYSKDEAWIQWHKELDSNFGNQQANSLWMRAWTIRGNSSANTLALRDYLKPYGITLSESAWDKVVDTGAGIGGFFGSMFSVGKYVGIAIAVVVIGGAGMIIFNIARKPGEAIGAATKAAML